jgi:AcrR family transcriptional regulator
MPAPIDPAARLDEIARATLEVARRGGAQAVTIRSVAARMGGSTTLITKFVPSRGELLLNAARYVRRDWEDDLAAALGDSTGLERMRGYVDWMCNTTKYDDVIRRQWVEMLATDPLDAQSLVDIRDEAQGERERTDEILQGTGLEERPWMSDLLFLAFRGYYVSTVEDASEWPAERARAAVKGMIDDLAATAPPTRRSPAKRRKR